MKYIAVTLAAILLAIVTIALASCAGDLALERHPDWAKEALDRQQGAGSL